MTVNLRSKALLRGLAAVAAAAAATSVVVLFGAGSADASQASLTLTYNCTFPLIGAQDLSVTISADLPDSATAGVATAAFPLSADVTVPAMATEGLSLVGATTVSGTASADSTLTNGATSVDLTVPLTVPTTAVPASGAFQANASGMAPSVTLTNVGTAQITVGNFSTTLTPLTSAGQPTSLGTFTVACTEDAGQNNVLATFPVVSGTPTTTTAPPTTTTTVAPPPTTTTTVAPPPTTTTTVAPPPTTTTTVAPPPTTTTTVAPPPTTTTTVAPPPTTTTTVAPPPTTTTTVAPPPTTTTTQPPTTTTAPPTTTTPPGNNININYSVNGTTHVKGLNANVTLGPGTLGVSLDLATGNFTANLALPQASVSATLLGFIPTTAKINFVAASPVTGTFTNGVVSATASETLDITDVTLMGIPVVHNSKTCMTSSPASIPLMSGSNFSIANGGTLTGTYTIPSLKGCGVLTPLLSAFVAGSGNTISVNIVPVTSSSSTAMAEQNSVRH